MKSTKQFRGTTRSADPEEVLKKPVKLAPIKKSGKDRHHIYSSVNDPEEDEDLDIGYRKKESVFDYFDDSDEGEEQDWDDENDYSDDSFEEDGIEQEDDLYEDNGEN